MRQLIHFHALGRGAAVVGAARSLLLIALAALVLCVTPALGQNGSRSWTGNTSTDFYDGTNWSAAGNFPNGNVTFRDSALSGAANTTIDRGSGTYNYVYGLYFNNTLGTENSYTINGPTKFFIGGSVIQTSTVTSGSLTDVINCNIQKAGSAETFNIGLNHDLTVNGVIFGGSTLTTKTGAGTLTLAGANTYSSGTLVNAGTLDLVGDDILSGALTVDGTGTAKLSASGHNAMDGLTALTIQNGGTYSDNSTADLVHTVSAAITFNNGGTMTSEGAADGNSGFGGFLYNNGINVTGTGLATINANRIGFAFAETVTVEDTVAGSGTDLLISSSIRPNWEGLITKAGAGTMELTGTNTDTAPWSISAGTLKIGGSGTLQSGSYANTIANNCAFVYNSSADQTMSGVISGTGTLTKDNSSTLTLSGSNTYSGGTTVDGGVLKLGNNSALGSTAGATTVSSGAELDGASFDPTSGENFTISGTGRDGAGGRGALYSTANSTSFAGGSTITLAADAEIGGGGGRIDNSATINGGGFNLIKVGTENWWNWSGSASNIDTLTVYTGQWLGFGNAALANAANDVHVMTNAEIMTWASGHSFTSPMAFDDNARFRNYWGAGNTSTHSISGDITLTGSPRFEDNGNSLGRRTLTISGAIGGTGNFTKNGFATLIFSGATSNTHSGTTTINGGSLTLSKTGGAVAVPGNLAIYSDSSNSARVWPTLDNQLGSANTVLSGDRTQGGLPAFALNGTTQSLAGIDSTSHDNLMIANSATSFGGITPSNSGTGTVNLVGSGAYVFNGYLWNAWGGGGTMAVTVNMTGAGNQTLQGDQINYTGATAINSGELILSGASNYKSATTVESGAILTWTHTTNLQNSQAGKTILLKDGSTLQNTNPNQWLVFNGASAATTVDTGASVTINHTSNATAAAGRGFYPDSGLKSTGGDTTATVTINTTNAGSGVNLRNNNSTFAGTLIVNGIASTTAYSGSGIGVSGNTTGLQNADIEVNGTMELKGGNGIGWANESSLASTFQMGVLNGAGIIVGNYGTAGGTALVTLGNTGNDGTFSGEIADGTNNTTSITKVGSGTQTLSGTSTNSGTTTVSAGTLSVTGTTGSGDVNVSSGGTLAGTGTIGGTVTVASGGVFSPGAP